MSAVGAKSLRTLHVSEAPFRLLSSPVTPPLGLLQGTQESYFTPGALVFVLPNIVSYWTDQETRFSCQENSIVTSRQQSVTTSPLLRGK